MLEKNKAFKQLGKKTWSVILAIALVLAIIPSAVFANIGTSEGALTFGVVSDIHYYPESLYAGDVDGFVSMSQKTISTSYLSEAIFDSAFAALAAHAEQNGMKYVLVPGDLTKNGEKEGHTALAARFAEFEEETGIEVFVVNGNHDVNRHSAGRFENGGFVSTERTTPEEFKSIYADFGYDHADSFYAPPAGEKGGMLSYAADLDGGYRLVVIDDGCYSADNTENGADAAETRGNITEGLKAWIIGEITAAKAAGKTVIGMSHHNMVPHFDTEESLFQDFPVDNWQPMAEAFADAGMHFNFSGHVHMQDIAEWTSDNGETMRDIATSSILSFPNYFREVTIDNTAPDNSVTMDVETFDVDCVRPVTWKSSEYTKPFKNVSFGLNFVGSDPANMVMKFVDYYLNDKYIPEITAAGGLYNFLNSAFDLGSVFDNLLNGGVKLGSLDIFTKNNLLSAVKQICDQVDKTYISNPAYLMDLVRTELNKLLQIELSDISCTKFIDTYGFGSTTRKGTLGDAVASCLAYIYSADEDISDDPFMQDVIKNFDNGLKADEIFNTLVEVALGDLIEGEIFKNINLSLKYFFPQGSFGAHIIAALDNIFLVILGGNNTLGHIVDFAFSALSSLGLLEYNSLRGLFNHLMDEYITDSQMETIAAEFARFFRCFTVDTNPGTAMDCNTSLVYAGVVPVTPTVEDLRLPSNISITFGTDSATTRNISWYTKLSLTATDIQLVPYSAAPQFTNELPAGVTAKLSTEKTQRMVPGIDFGVFGILNYWFNLNRHIVELSGLTPGTKYCYRIGDAERGWWSDIGVLETADNSNALTFLHMSDCQAGIERQYKVWADTLETAFDMFPDTDFIMHTGDLSDSGNNFRHWNWMFNTAADTLQSTVLMPTAGNHEAHGEYALDRNFVLSGVPEQNTETGCYYSFDYNNTHFIVLNTNDLNDKEALSAEQIAWLKADAKASNAMWKVVALHKAPYSNGSHYDDDDVIQIRKQLKLLMPQLGIDVVLQGHDHVYLRTDTMINNMVEPFVKEIGITKDGRQYTAKVNPDGTIYVISACSGVKYYQTKSASMTDRLFPRAETIVDATYPVFSAFQIEGNMLYFDAYGIIDGTATMIDSFAIQK